ncbi:hypothetical protein SO802_021193 [Lithocarpus litseifolius]|uniref:Uncharacterized protein n=1 Tax=Lithocarpus litseifolius TaxID=425828 RepID=A0AAW2CEK3_9ROSI
MYSTPLVEAHPSHSSSLIGSEDGDRHSSDKSATSLHGAHCSALAAWLLPLPCSMLADPDRHSKSPRGIIRRLCVEWSGGGWAHGMGLGCTSARYIILML